MTEFDERLLGRYRESPWLLANLRDAVDEGLGELALCDRGRQLANEVLALLDALRAEAEAELR